MKKQLFATTALVAAVGFGASAAHAQDASLDLSASSAFYANYVDQDVPPAGSGYDDGDYDFSTNTEFEVSGMVTLDNGITAGLDIEVEADNADGTNFDGDNIDENVIYLEGSFGRLEFGNEDGPADVMDYGATSIKAVYPGGYNNTTGTFINRTNGAPITPVLFDSSDGTKITYYTPRFAGFQLGASLAPDSAQADPVFPTRPQGGLQNHIEWGGNYVNSFNGFDLAASLTGNYGADAPTGAEEPYSVTGGLVLGFAGFEFGGSAAFGEDTAENDLEAYDLGVAYSTGPWSVSLTGLYSTIEIDGTGDEDDLVEGQLGVNYALGSGVSIFGTGTYGEHESESAGASDNEYTSLLSGVSVSF